MVEHCALSGSDLKIKSRTILFTSMSAMRQISIATFWSYDTPISYVCKELLGIHF